MALDMEMRLRGRLQLSAALPTEGERLLEAFFRDEAPGLLARGAPEGLGPRVEEWSAGDGYISLTIASGRYVRAHDALMRLRKALAAALGKSLRVGIRGAAVDEYVITFPLTCEPLRPFTLPLVDSATFDGASCTMVLTDVDEEFLARNHIDRIIRLADEKSDAQRYEGKGEHWELLWASAEKQAAWSADPTEAMAGKGWLVQGPTKGKWFFRPEAAALMRAMERIAVEEVLVPLGFQEVIESHIVPLDTWAKTGHLEGSPNEIYYVCQPRTRDPAEWEAFRDHLSVTRQVDHDMLRDLLDLPRAGISYAQCPNIYWSFKGATISREDLPVLVFDRAANSCRYESGGRHGIERVDEFHRIEPVYMGTEDQLLEIRQRLLERYTHVFEKILELEWRMAWVTPFYMQQAGKHGLDPDQGTTGGAVCGRGGGGDGGEGGGPAAEGSAEVGGGGGGKDGGGGDRGGSAGKGAAGGGNDGGGGNGPRGAVGVGGARWPVEDPMRVGDLLPSRGTIDFETYMPYRGSRVESEWLEFQNLTISGTIFTGPFNIKTQKGELWSGCSGIGLERWTAAFLAQKGMDPERWPEGFRKYLPQMPRGYRLL